MGNEFGGDENPFVAGVAASLTLHFLNTGDFADAEPSARECLRIRENKLPDHVSTFIAKSLLGGTLLGREKYAEAEPLLLSGYGGMKQREDRIYYDERPRLKENLQWLVQLYEATGKTDQAAEWKQKLADFNQAEAEKFKEQSVSPPVTK